MFAAVPLSYRGLLTASELLVFTALAWRDNGSRTCWPSHATLASDTGLSARRVRSVLSALHEKGAVSWERNTADGKGNISNVYTINYNGISSQKPGDHDPPPDDVPTEASFRTPTEISDPTEASFRTPTEAHFLPLRNPTSYKADTNEADTSRKQTPNIVQQRQDAFDEFWRLYPRRQGKGKAFEAFAKAVKAVKAETIIDGAKRFALDPNLPEARFIPLPATWLSQGRWDDEHYLPGVKPPGSGSTASERAQSWAEIDISGLGATPTHDQHNPMGVLTR